MWCLGNREPTGVGRRVTSGGCHAGFSGRGLPEGDGAGLPIQGHLHAQHDAHGGCSRRMPTADAYGGCSRWMPTARGCPTLRAFPGVPAPPGRGRRGFSSLNERAHIKGGLKPSCRAYPTPEASPRNPRAALPPRLACPSDLPLACPHASGISPAPAPAPTTRTCFSSPLISSSRPSARPRSSACTGTRIPRRQSARLGMRWATRAAGASGK